MPDDVAGVPTHPLVVHATVVLLPLAALTVLLVALVPAVRRRYSLLAVVLAALAFVSVPLATSSGGSLADRLPRTLLIQHHIDLAGRVLPAHRGRSHDRWSALGLRWRRPHRGPRRGALVAAHAAMGDGRCRRADRHPAVLRDRCRAGRADRAAGLAVYHRPADQDRYPRAGRPVGAARLGPAAPRPAGRDHRPEGRPRADTPVRPDHRCSDSHPGRACLRLVHQPLRAGARPGRPGS